LIQVGRKSGDVGERFAVSGKKPDRGAQIHHNERLDETKGDSEKQGPDKCSM